MTRLLMLSLAITMVAGVAVADHIGVYSDAAGTYCSGPIAPQVPVTSYVVHHTNGSTGSQFRVQDDTGLIQLGSTVTPPFLVIGTPYTDLALAYTSCLSGPAIMVVSLQHFASPPVTACVGMEVVGSPGKLAPIVNDCATVDYWASGGAFYFNGIESEMGCYCPTIATEESTWGRVKSLYR